MKIKEFVEKYGNLEIDEVELKKVLNVEESKVWKPKEDEEFYYLDFCGDINFDVWCCDKCQGQMYAIGNCFKTREEAEFMVEKLKVIAELKRFALEHNELDSNLQDNWYLHHSLFFGEVGFSNTEYRKLSNIYFTSKEITEAAIKAIGEDRLKKYYFEVGE